MSERPPTVVFVCDVCAAEKTVAYHPSLAAFARADGSKVSIGGHAYEACVDCVRAIWAHLAYLRSFGTIDRDGSKLPYIIALDDSSPNDVGIVANMTNQGAGAR